jgi:two-component system CheB/CheR fusion protein
LTSSEKEVSTATGEWYLRRVSPYRTQDDRIEGVVVTFADITPIKRTALDMQRLAAVVRDSNDAIILFDFTGRILAWNHGAKWMYGYDEAEALQLNIDALVPENVRPIQSALLERILSGEPIKSYEIQRITRDGREIDVWLTVSVLRDESGSPMAIATTERDVTEKIRRSEPCGKESHDFDN